MCRVLYAVVALMLPHVSQPFCSIPGVAVTASSRWLTPAASQVKDTSLSHVCIRMCSPETVVVAAEGAAAKRERSAEAARERSGTGETLRPLASMKKKTNEPSTESIQAELADLLASGIVQVWRKDDAPRDALAGGARGAGYNQSSSQTHEEPNEIYLVGTSHISLQSAADVERVIRAVRPDNVVVELCRSRAGMMYAEEPAPPPPPRPSEEAPDTLLPPSNATARALPAPFSISGNNAPQAIWRSLVLGGPVAFLLRVALSKNSALASTFATTGADFRAARRAAEEFHSVLVLGDRPIEITLERSWRALMPEDKWKMFQLLRKGLSVSQGDVTQAVDQVTSAARDDTPLLDRYGEMLAESFPALVAPLVTERDIFLSLTMKSSMAVNGCNRVVGVVGKGHAKGVLKCLSQDHTGKFKELTWTPTRAAAREKILGIPKILFDRLIVDTILFLVVYQLYQLWVVS